MIASIDPCGRSTKISYNARKKPCVIEYPDGSRERNEYTLDGLLERSIDKNGTIILHHYDELGHVIQKISYPLPVKSLSLVHQLTIPSV